MQVYHGVITIPNTNGVSWELTSRIWCWSLNQWGKCVYLDPALFVSTIPSIMAIIKIQIGRNTQDIKSS
jgi:hypothetical protein